MAKGNGGNNQQQGKGAATSITGSMNMDPATIAKGEQNFRQHMAGNAVVACTMLVASGVMYGLTIGGKLLFYKLFPGAAAKIEQNSGSSDHGDSSSDRPDAGQIMSYCNKAVESLGDGATPEAVADMVLEYNPELSSHEGMVKGIAKQAVIKRN